MSEEKGARDGAAQQKLSSATWTGRTTLLCADYRTATEKRANLLAEVGNSFSKSQKRQKNIMFFFRFGFSAGIGSTLL